MKTTATALAFLTFAFLSAFTAQADTFGSGTNQFDIEFVPIGNPGNPADTTGDPNPAGKVDYAYRMGKYEISRDMIAKANDEGGLGITMGPMDFVAGGARDDMPATGISWNEAARFVNWLNTTSGRPPAYKFALQPGDVGYSANADILLWEPGDAGYNPNNRFRNSQAFYFLPTVDEWYKAAYYDPASGSYIDYPTGSDTAPTPVASGTAAGTAVYLQTFQQGPADITLAGGLSPYGTMGQGGNAWEWEETEFDLVNDFSTTTRGVRGGYWRFSSVGLLATLRIIGGPTFEDDTVGFRVASIPEPSTALLGALAAGGLLLWRRR